MFIGHFAIGLATKRVAPAVSLGWLFLAVQFVDLLWPTLLLLGKEQVEIDPGNTAMTPLDFIYYPISHSLTMGIVWGMLVSLVYWTITRNNRGAWIITLCVISHWFLDLLVHRPDLPLFPNDTHKMGLGLWNHVLMSQIIEWGLFIAGIMIYTRTTKPINAKGSWVFWLLVVLLSITQLANIFSPPPPSVQAIAWAGQAQWVFILLAFWTDRNRVSRNDTIVSSKAPKN
jgi:hypothetical protein